MPIQTLDLHKLPDAEIQCARCDVPMKMAGDLALAQSPPGDPPLVGWVKFDVYLCARCGKAELFL